MKRRIHLYLPPDAELKQRIATELGAVAGVESVSLRGRTVKVRYDLTMTHYTALCEHIQAMGITLNERWPWNWLASWRQSNDETGRENAGLPPSHCCNRAPRL